MSEVKLKQVEAYEQWWSGRTSEGDPAHRLCLPQEAFHAGYLAGMSKRLVDEVVDEATRDDSLVARIQVLEEALKDALVDQELLANGYAFRRDDASKARQDQRIRKTREALSPSVVSQPSVLEDEK